MSDWDERFIRIAKEVASWSKDKHTQVGCVLVKDKRIIAEGYNGLAQGLNDNIFERFERPEKYNWMVHAELNAIINCAREGISTKGATAYVTPLPPCSDCASYLIQAKIPKVIIKVTEEYQSRLKDETHLRAFEMCKEVGIDLCILNDSGYLIPYDKYVDALVV